MTTATFESIPLREAATFRPTNLLRSLGEHAYSALIGFEAHMTKAGHTRSELQHLADYGEIDYVIRERLVAQHAIRGYEISS
jgi:hypothetical protein